MHIYLRGGVLQRLRLASGLVLFAFAATHFLNHALGLLSFEAMHQAQDLRKALTRSAPGTIVLLAALITHVSLGLHKLARRETWKMPRWEALQIGFGLAIPFLLFPHIVNTRIAHLFFGVSDTYLYELVRLWPDNAPLQSLLLLLVWGHGCMGVHYWLRLSERYRSLAPVLVPLAMAVPLLGLAGFAVAGRAAADIMSDPTALQALKERSRWPNASDSASLALLRDFARIAFAALLTTVAGFCLLRRAVRPLRRSRARITYVNGPSVDLLPGMTLLEASRSAGVRHASVCGGRARCSTCRVRIEMGRDTLLPPTGAEAATLTAIEAPPNVRLACQIRPSASLTVAVVSHPAAPGPVQVEFLEIKAVVAAHVRAILAGQLVDLVSSDPATVSQWLRGNVTYPLVVPYLGFQGFALVGGRVDYLLDRPAAALVYACGDGVITLFVLPGGEFGALAVRGQRNGYHVLAWAEEDLAYVATSDLVPEQLDKLQESLSAFHANSLGDPVQVPRVTAKSGPQP
jgi:adenylate cyclase